MVQRRKPRAAAVVACAALAAAVLDTAAGQLGPNAPLRDDLGANTEAARHALGRAAALGPVEALAGGRNVAVHFDEPVPTVATGTLMCGVYFGLNYDLYPARAVIGSGRPVINGDGSIRAADRVPLGGWRGVPGVGVAVDYRVDAAGLHQLDTRSLPETRRP